MGLSRWLQNHWYRASRSSWVDWLLCPFSLLYKSAAYVRHWLYIRGILPTRALPVPVVVIGNVVAGGAGKTPLTIALVRALMQRGLRVGVIARGYGRSSSSCLEVGPHATAKQVGDEPLLIYQQTQAPVFVAPKRFEAGLALLSTYPDTDLVVCDDGLQHFALKRDVQLCVFSALGIGNGKVIPAGPLRESWPRTRGQTIDLVVQFGMSGQATRPLPVVDVPVWLLQRDLANFACNAQGQRRSLQSFVGNEEVCAVAGVAHPRAFFDMLRTRGIQLKKAVALPDHYDFEAQGLPTELQGAGCNSVVCTEKDAVKLWSCMPEAWAVPLRVNLTDEHVDMLLSLLRYSQKAGHRVFPESVL